MIFHTAFMIRYQPQEGVMQFLMCLCYVHSIPNEILQTDISTQINPIQIFFLLAYFSSWSINFLFFLSRSSKPFLASSDFLEAMFWRSCATWIPEKSFSLMPLAIRSLDSFESDSACFKLSSALSISVCTSLFFSLITITFSCLCCSSPFLSLG